MRVIYNPSLHLYCVTLFEPKAGEEGHSVTLYPSQVVVAKQEHDNGWRTWYPFRFRWWPNFKNNSLYDALRSLGWVTRRYFGDEGKPPRISKRRRELYEQAVVDFRQAVEDINKLPLGPVRYSTYQRMQEAARRQSKYTRYPRR